VSERRPAVPPVPARRRSPAVRCSRPAVPGTRRSAAPPSMRSRRATSPAFGGAAPLFAQPGHRRALGHPLRRGASRTAASPIHFTIAAGERSWPVSHSRRHPRRKRRLRPRHHLQRDNLSALRGLPTGSAAPTAGKATPERCGGCARTCDAPRYLTSADGAGLPVFPVCSGYDEIGRRRDSPCLCGSPCLERQRAFVESGDHWASDDTDPSLPPMGLRLRLKASVDAATFPGAAQVIVTALQRYGLLVAENGNAWWLSEFPTRRFSTAELAALQTITGDSFEAVSTGPLTTD